MGTQLLLENETLKSQENIPYIQNSKVPTLAIKRRAISIQIFQRAKAEFLNIQLYKLVGSLKIDLE